MSSIYENKLRVRACGVLVEEDRLLLVKLHSPVSDSLVWTPPGGGVQFGESIFETVEREFLEETSLKVKAEKIVHINELIQKPFHAIEIYVSVKRLSGEMKLGNDPEHDENHQILSDVGFFDRYEVQEMNIKPEYFKEEFWGGLGK